MKIIPIILILASIPLSSSKYLDQQSKAGILFFKGSWSEVLEKSNKENKPIFLDLYASWCGVCRVLKTETFSDTTAGAFFNEHFLNVAMDGEKGEGKELFQKHILGDNHDPKTIVKGYPRLLFFNKKGELVHSTSGFHSAEELIILAKESLKKIN